MNKALLLTGLIALQGCASLGGDKKSPEVMALETRLLEQTRRATVGELEVARLEAELAKVKAELKAGKAELEVRRKDDLLRDKVGAESIGLGGREIEGAELEEPVEEPVMADVEAVANAPVDPKLIAAAPADAQTLYDRAYTYFHQKKYAEAEAYFTLFFQRFATSDLADNALFWIGECRWARADPAGALAAFSETVARFPNGNKVADALLKAGKSLEQLGRTDDAIATYRELRSRFDGSAAAGMAAERLRALGQ